MSNQVKYIRIHTLQCRGPIEGEPDREVDGILLSAEEPAISFDAAHSETGHDRIELWPAFHNGVQCWIESRRWVASPRYSAWGTQSRIVSLEDGIRILIDRGLFTLTPPAAE